MKVSTRNTPLITINHPSLQKTVVDGRFTDKKFIKKAKKK